MSITTTMMEPLGFWLKNLETKDLKLVSPPITDGQSEGPQKQASQAKRESFSDADLNKLLSGIGLKPSSRLREIAKFLMIHRFTLSADLVRQVQTLLPEGPYVGQKAEALIAALSKLPTEQVARGFEILSATLNRDHPTVMGSLKHFVSMLNDILSVTRLTQGQVLSMELIQAAFSEELDQWQSWLNKPEQQLLALFGRQNLIQDLRRFIHLSQWAAKILEQLDPKQSENLRKRMGLASKAADHAAKVLLADGIMSKSDDAKHMRDHGLCYSLGLDWEDELIPCRMWAFDDDHLENIILDEKNIHLFFRIVSESLGLIELELLVDSDQMTLKFASLSSDIRMLIDQNSESLKEHLTKLGYELSIYPAQSKLRQIDPNVEIESRSSQDIVHMDTQA